MRILFLTQIVPYPPDAGPKVKTWNVLRFLAALGHEVVLVTYCRDEERRYLPDLERVCQQVHAVDLRRSRVADVYFWLRSLISGRPFLIERDDSRAMRRVISRLMGSQPFDVIHADQLTMTQFAIGHGENRQSGRMKGGPGRVPAPRRVFDAHNAVWTILDRMRSTAPIPLRPVVALERDRVARYEGRIVAKFDYTLAVSEVDRQALMTVAGAAMPEGDAAEVAIGVVPIAVDTDQLQPPVVQCESTQILTIGTLHYPPNADGIRWFLSEVFPLVRASIPQASLTVIGKNPPSDLVELAKRYGPAVTLTGYVRDLDPHMNRAAVMVVPVRAGGGMRVRILEGFARGMPMVTTTVGLEGIQAQPGQHIMVADSVETFADAVVDVLSDVDLRNRLSAQGRKLAETNYDWQIALARLSEAYAMDGTE